MSKVYTPAVLDAIETSLRLGNTRRAAAEYAGINRDTFYAWLKDEKKMTFPKDVVSKGKNGQPDVTRHIEERVFAEMVVQAEADGQNSCVAIIRKAAQGGALKSRRTYTRRDGSEVVEEEFALPQWTAAAWLLERKNPQEWAQKKRDDTDLSKYSDDELLAMIADEDKDNSIGLLSDNNPPPPKRIAGPPRYAEPVPATQIVGGDRQAEDYLEANTRRAGVQEPRAVSK